MVIPGWPQLYCGRRLRGQMFLAAWIVLLGGGLLFAGTGVGSLFLGLAISCHAASVLDLALIGTTGVFERLARSVVVLVLLTTCLYWPMGWLIGHVASTQRILADGGRLTTGSVVLVNRSFYRHASPRPGDIVLYEIPETRVTARLNIGFNANIIIRGQRLDRILATAGQTVDLAPDRLIVDGHPSTWRPLNPERLRTSLQMVIPPDCVLILPSTDANIPDASVRDVCLISTSRIAARAYWQTQPLSRFGPLH